MSSFKKTLKEIAQAEHPQQEGFINKALRLIDTPLIHDIPGGKELMDKLAQDNNSPTLARLKGFGVGALEGLTKPTTLAQIATLPLTPGARFVPGLANVAKSAAYTGRVLPGAITAVDAGLTAQSGKKTLADVNDPKVGKLQTGLDAANTLLLGLGTGAGGAATIKGVNAASQQAAQAGHASKQMLKDAMDLYRSERASQTPLDPHDVLDLIQSDARFKPLLDDVTRNKGGDIAKEIFPPINGKKMGYPEPLSIEQQNIRNQKKAAADLQAAADLETGQAQTRKALDKDLYDATKTDAANQKPIAKAEEKLAKDQGAALEANKKVDEAARKARGAAEDKNIAVDKAREKEQGQALEANKKVDEKTRRERGAAEDTNLKVDAKRQADAQREIEMEQGMLRKAEEFAAKQKEAKAQQSKIDQLKTGENIEEVQGPVRETSKGKGPDGETQVATKTYREKPPEEEGGDGGSDAGPSYDGPTTSYDRSKIKRIADKLGGPDVVDIVKRKDGSYEVVYKDEGPDLDSPQTPATDGGPKKGPSGGTPTSGGIQHEDAQLDPATRKELERINDEMQTFNYSSHTFNDDLARQGSTPEIVGGSAGAPVYHDIVSEGGSGTRGNVTTHIQNLLKGKINANGLTKTQRAALNVAEARANGTWRDRGFSAPALKHADEPLGSGLVPEISDYTGGAPEHTIEAPVPTASEDIPPEFAQAVDDLAAEHAKAGGPPEVGNGPAGGPDTIPPPEEPPTATVAQPPKPKRPKGPKGGAKASKPLPSTQKVIDDLMAEAAGPVPDALRSKFQESAENLGGLKTFEPEPNLPEVAGPGGGVPKPLAEEPPFRLTPEVAETKPVEPTLPLEAPPEAPEAPTSAPETPPAQTPLEAAGARYGAIKEAKAAGDQGYEPARTFAGKEAARLKKEATLTDPDSSALENLDPTTRDAVLKDLVKKFMSESGRGGNQSGFSNIDLMTHAASAGAGGIAGYKYGDDNDHPYLGAALGAGAGLAVPSLAAAGVRALHGAAPEIPEVAGNLVRGMNKFKNSAILGPYAVAKKGAADLQALGIGALQKPDRAGDIFKEFVTPSGLGRSINRFKEGASQPYLDNRAGIENFVTNKYNPLSWSGRLMGGLTNMTKGALGEAGYTIPEQEALTMTEDLTSQMPIVKHPVVQHIFPFMNMAFNRAKRGFEYSPLTFLNGKNWAHDKRSEALFKASLGTLAGGVASQATPEGFVKDHPLATSILAAGPTGLPTLLGMAAGSAPVKKEGLEQSINDLGAGMQETSRELPGFLMLQNLASGDPKGIARNYFSSYTNGLRPLAELINPEDVDTSSASLPIEQSIFNRMLSGIPLVRGTLPQTGRESRSPFSGLFSQQGINP